MVFSITSALAYNNTVMKITQVLLDDLTAQAKASSRLRMNYDLRNSSADQSQRMLNAIEPGVRCPSIGIDILPKLWFAFAAGWYGI